MVTEIRYQTYSGGGGGDPDYFIGYCKDNKLDVAKKLITTHKIYSYNGIHPIPIKQINAMGIVLCDITEERLARYGIKEVGTFNELFEYNQRWFKYAEWERDKKPDFIDGLNRIIDYLKNDIEEPKKTKKKYKDLEKILNDFIILREYIIKNKADWCNDST